MRGYWNLPDESAEALRGGWMHTGDAGYIDKDGFLYIQDRVKDMIVSGGENVYPRTIEDVLFKHPAIADAAVIGVPDPTWGEWTRRSSCSRKGSGRPGKKSLSSVRDKLRRLRAPALGRLRPVLPRNATGKVLKKELRAPYWAEGGRQVAGS